MHYEYGSYISASLKIHL